VSLLIRLRRETPRDRRAGATDFSRRFPCDPRCPKRRPPEGSRRR
jgi:hypothetical protein